LEASVFLATIICGKDYPTAISPVPKGATRKNIKTLKLKLAQDEKLISQFKPFFELLHKVEMERANVRIRITHKA
jgi:hypothetical protein